MVFILHHALHNICVLTLFDRYRSIRKQDRHIPTNLTNENDKRTEIDKLTLDRTQMSESRIKHIAYPP